NPSGRRNVGHILRNYLAMPRYSPLSLMGQNRAIAGVNIGHLWGAADLLSSQIDRLLALYTEGRVRPVIDSRFPFDQAAAAHRRIEERKNVGKVLLVP